MLTVNPYNTTLTEDQVYTLFKSVGHTEYSAKDIAKAHSKGVDFSFMF